MKIMAKTKQLSTLTNVKDNLVFSTLRKREDREAPASKEANVSFREPKNPFLTGKASKETNVNTGTIDTRKLVAKD
ncbi:Uncharacterised protein [uncultured archaeon]|nr:Uncharacterised protein [uncultured archaeon]